jgi:hypothetical protein
VHNCQTCLQAKPDQSAYPGKLQPLSIPSMTWETITMDFVEGLPVSGPANCILVVVDKFTKYAHFIPLYHPYTPSSVAQTFMTHVYRLHGLPASIVSDRDPVFTSTFWQQLFKLIGNISPMFPTTPKLTAKRNTSTNAWKHFSDVSSVHVPRSGKTGYQQLSFGIILVCTPLWVVRHLRLYMAESLELSVL